MCRQTYNIRRNLAGNKIADQSDVVGTSPVGAASDPRVPFYQHGLTSIPSWLSNLMPSASAHVSEKMITYPFPKRNG